MTTARQIVFSLLLKMQKSAAYSNIALDAALSKSSLSQQDKSFASALFYGVLERQITLDEIIKNHSDKPFEKMSADVVTALRMGIYQLEYMNSVPDSAAVNESVKLMKNVGAKSFVNAILRKYQREGKQVLEGFPEYLKLSCPKWLYDKWKKEYGKVTADKILPQTIGAPPVFCRVNNLKTTWDRLSRLLEPNEIYTRNTDIDNCLILKNAGSIEQLDAYKNGFLHIQDMSAQICVKALEAKENEIVFDLCAAPGGKTFTIAEDMNNCGQVFAFDLHDNRVRLIKSGAKRLGISIIKAKEGDARNFDESLPKADKVLCDVPCSGLGIIRRKPEIKYKNPADFEKLPQIQFDILNNAAKYVKVGGSLLYSTCTLSRAENDEVRKRFLSENPQYEAQNLPSDIKRNQSELTIFPTEFGGDGFYIAKFKKVR